MISSTTILPLLPASVPSQRSDVYSDRNELTGLTMAAFIAWKLIVNRATADAEIPAIANTLQPIGTRYSKFSSQLFIAHHARGVAITNASRNKIRKSFYINPKRDDALAPSTFLIPISFVRCSAVNNTRPNHPRQEMKMARKAK